MSQFSNSQNFIEKANRVIAKHGSNCVFCLETEDPSTLATEMQNHNVSYCKKCLIMFHTKCRFSYVESKYGHLDDLLLGGFISQEKYNASNDGKSKCVHCQQCLW
jgi:hypothetical protein